MGCAYYNLGITQRASDAVQALQTLQKAAQYLPHDQELMIHMLCQIRS